MPRSPLGVYTRDTGDWFIHDRAWVTVAVIDKNNNSRALGFVNNDQSGRVAHVLGVNVVEIGILGPVWEETYCQGFYFSALNSPFSPDFAIVAPFFDEDGIPMLDPVAGIGSGLGYPPGNPLIIPMRSSWYSYTTDPDLFYTYASASYYPPGGLAAMRGGRGFALQCGDQIDQFWTVTFDVVMLPD